MGVVVAMSKADTVSGRRDIFVCDVIDFKVFIGDSWQAATPRWVGRN